MEMSLALLVGEKRRGRGGRDLGHVPSLAWSSAIVLLSGSAVPARGLPEQGANPWRLTWA